MALDLRIKRRRHSDSDEEDNSMDRRKSSRYPSPPSVYAFKIRHVCKDCEGILKIMSDEGRIKLLSSALKCPSCGHKAMHQSYYNLCSMCARLLRRCVMCCGDRNIDHIDPRDVILTPTLKTVLEVFPQPYQRILLRFVFKKWEAYLGTQDFPIEEFRQQFITLAYDFIDDIYMKRTIIQAPNLQDHQIQELINIQRESAYRIADRVIHESTARRETEEDDNMALNISKMLRTNQWLQNMVRPLPEEIRRSSTKRNLRGSVITGIKSVQQQLLDIRSELETAVERPSNRQLNVSPNELQLPTRSVERTSTKVKRCETVTNITDDERSHTETVFAGPSHLSGRRNPVSIDLTNSENNSEVDFKTTSTSVLSNTLAAEEARLKELAQQLEMAIAALTNSNKTEDNIKNTQSSKPETKQSNAIAACSSVDRKNIKNINFSDIKVSFEKSFYRSIPKPSDVSTNNENNAQNDNKGANEKKDKNPTN